jgi:hypothetical protein
LLSPSFGPCSFFEKTGADLILLPSGRCATPDLAKLASGEVPLTCLPGSDSDTEVYGGIAGDIWMDQCAFKHLHIPKMAIPTGLTEDGRPTAIQIWGRAVPYELMFDDEYSAKHDLEFLYLVQRVSAAIQANASLERKDAEMAKRSLEE